MGFGLHISNDSVMDLSILFVLYLCKVTVSIAMFFCFLFLVFKRKGKLSAILFVVLLPHYWRQNLWELGQ